MIITLKGILEASKHLGGLGFYYIRDNTSGMTLTLSKTSIKKEGETASSVTGTLTVLDNYTISENVKITMGSTDKTSSWYKSGAITIPVSEVTDNIVISGKAVSSSSSGEDDVGTTTKLISETGATLTENYALSSTSYTGSTNTTYYTYSDIPVEAGKTYRIQYCRRVWELDADKAAITTFAAHTEREDYTFTVGDTTAYISITIKTEEIAPENVTIETIN